MIFLLQTAPAELPGGYGWELARAGLSLVAVCVIAWVILRWASKRGLGASKPGQRMEVLERLPLDPRRSLHLVRVGERILVVGTGEGAPTLLTELAAADVPAPEPAAQPRSFAELLRRRDADDEPAP
ncbi:MAG: flagellar biosynthetic protein FliO [Sandaracinus sp.]|nr:flagellar biosynthetic protein FliO [Sandaracinus sp.]